MIYWNPKEVEDLVINSAIQLAIGLALGLGPFFIAKHKQAMKYGISSIALCAIAGLLVGLIGSVPIAIVLAAIAAVSSTSRLKALGEQEPDGPKDIAIFLAFLFLAIGILVVWAFQVDALG